MNKPEIDLTRITMREWRELWNPETPAEREDELFAKILGITPDEWLDMPQPEVRRYARLVLKAGTEPMSDPT